MGQRIVGVEFGRNSIEFVQLNKPLFGKTYVEKLGSFPISGGMDATGKIISPEVIAENLKELWKSEGLQTRHVALGIGGTEVFVREFSAPNITPKELATTLPALAESELPMPTTELYLDFYANRILESNNKKTVGGILVAALKTSVDNLMAACEAAGLKPGSLDLIPFAVTRQLSKNFQDDSVAAVVHASHGTMNIAITKGKIPIFVRVVPIPVSVLSSNGSAETAANEGSNESADPLAWNQTNFDSGFQDVAIRELQETLSFYNRNHSNEPVSDAVVSGIDLQDDSWIERASSTLGLPIVKAEVIDLFKVSEPKSELVERPIDPELLVAYSLVAGRNGLA